MLYKGVCDQYQFGFKKFHLPSQCTFCLKNCDILHKKRRSCFLTPQKPMTELTTGNYLMIEKSLVDKYC